MSMNPHPIEYSVSKALYHTDKIKALQQGQQITPTEIQVDLEAYCNDNCSFCSYRKEDGYNNRMLELINAKPGTAYHDDRPVGKPSPESRIPLEFADKFPEQMLEAGIPAIEITGGGEPTLWGRFNDLVENLGKAGLEIGLVTNGSLLTDQRIKLLTKYCTWIRISMDSSNPETHKEIHRTANYDFDRRLNSIKKLALSKSEELILGISFIVTPDNYDDIENSARLFASVGVNHIRFSWMYDREGHAGLTQEQIDNLKKLLDKLMDELNRDDFRIIYEHGRIESYSKPNTDFNTCYYQRFVWAIGADCKVYPCCIQKYHPDFAYGDIREKTLKELVNDLKTISAMNSLDVTKCYPCWLRNRNKAIAKAVEKPIHVNFI